MRDKQGILAEIREGLDSGLLTEADLKSFITTQPEPSIAKVEEPQVKSGRLSAVEVMFYIAGIVFASAIISIIAQSWDDAPNISPVILSAGIGAALWTVVYYLQKSSYQSDIRKGMINALLLTGSLLIIAGGYIVTFESTGGVSGDSGVIYITGAVALAVLGAIHLGFDRLVKKELTLLMGVLLGVAAFPTLLFGMLLHSDALQYVWQIIIIASAALLIYAARVVAKIHPDRQKHRNSFDAFAVFIALASMYASIYGDFGIFWLAILIASVFGIFYLSIISQNKHLLGNASFFLILTVITIAFKYFSGFGVTASLIVATLGLLGSAAVASSINKKYFKQPKQLPV